MSWVDYEYRINKLDEFMNNISTDTNTKFIILSVVHYIFLFILIYYNLFFSKNIYVFYICYLILIIQIALNLWDNGCFMMKLERKYTGKWWYGAYTVFNYLKKDIINPYSCSILFRVLSSSTFLYALYRLYNYHNGTDFVTLESNIEENIEEIVKENVEENVEKIQDTISEDNIVINPL